MALTMRALRDFVIVAGCFTALSSAIAGAALAPVPSPIPVGYDAYRQWDHWPYQRIGMRAYMRSTYDRTGGNRDASNFLYQLSDSNNITLDVAGTGVLYFARYNHWHGSPWHYEVDGTDQLVQETSSADPTKPVPGSVFLPADAFPPPLTATWSDTKGADLSWVPIPFEKSFRMGYSRTHYGTGYYIYDQYVPGTRLSAPIKRWTRHTLPARDVLDLIQRAGTDISPSHGFAAQGVLSESGADRTNVLFTLTQAPSMIRKLVFSVPRDEALAFGRARLRITWDNRTAPSVDAPVALFFGAGTLYNRDDREYLVKAFPSYIRYGQTNVELACFLPMPFFKSARVELIGPKDESVSNIAWQEAHQPFGDPPAQVGYFHATYHDFPQPESGKDLVLLDTRQTEGGGDWSGNFVGNSWIFSHQANLGTLEGDPRFFFDDSRTPQAQGTGTEEWGGGGDYWGGQNMTLPFAGHPTGATNPKTAKNADDQIESAYRFLLADLMPFGKHAVICLEHGGIDESTQHYQSVTYWYGAPAPALVKTDELKIGNAASEQSHHYTSPQASAPYQIVSRYEWGADRVNGQEVFPSETDSGRKTTGTSEFTLKLDPNNLGVMLRRKLDYSFPNQRAEVYVASDTKWPFGTRWKFAGIWYLAGANTWVRSDPRGELGATQHRVETSNRRFRDDDFLLPLALTKGRSIIQVSVKFTPVEIPLYPGRPLSELAWSEIRYDAYCYTMPEWQP